MERVSGFEEENIDTYPDPPISFEEEDNSSCTR